ncbi:hypothetical protein ACFQ5E_12005 [Oceanobacillus sojae]
MMNNYTFTEQSSKNVERNGEQVRLVTFRGSGPRDGIDNEYLNVDGRVDIPLMDYFMAGMENRIPALIKDKVIEQLTAREQELEGKEENAE